MSRSTNNKPASRAGIIGRLFPMFARDADPEAVAEVLEELAECLEKGSDDELVKAPEPNLTAPSDPPPDSLEKEVPHWVKGIMDRIDAIDECVKIIMKADDSDPLEALEKELSGNGEEIVTIKAEECGDEGGECDEAQVDEDPVGVGKHQQDSRAAFLAALRAAKPTIAAIEDPAQRKSVSDSLVKVIRASMGVPLGGNSGTYSAIIDAKQDAANKHAARDKALVSNSGRASKLGQELAKKHNPHYRDNN